MKRPVRSKPPKRHPARNAAKSAPTSPVKSQRRADRSFPIVGIGASAGGLEALVQFLEHVPADSGMAFVIIQHLDPTHKGMMPELLQRATAMKVVQVKDRTRVQPDCVYVIPPNSDMSLLHGALHLLTPVASRGLRLPIDFFFRSLAEDQQERSVGVILSGMGSDGTLGLRAIKEKAGVALVQDPATAKFDAMPRSAIEAGLADFVAPAEELPGKLIGYSRHLPRISGSKISLEEKAQGALEKIVILGGAGPRVGSRHGAFAGPGRQGATPPGGGQNDPDSSRHRRETQTMKKQPNTSGGAGELRRRAEHRLREQLVKGAQIGTKAEMQRILQELQIHQIELEMQNEELKQAKAEVDAGLEKYTDLYDFAPVGYFSLDEQGLILEVNLTGAALLGVERSGLTRRRFQLYVAPPSRPAFNAFLGRIFAGNAKQVCEVSLLNAGREFFWADLQAMSAVTISGARKWCRVAVIDITARKLAETAEHRIGILAASNRQLQEEIVRRQAVETALKKSEHRAQQLLEQSRQMQKKLRHFSHQILMAQEQQRKEISRELHDKICQLLVGIHVHLVMFAKAAVINPQGIRRAIGPMRRMVEESLRTVHQFARELRPASLDDLGLIPALRSYIDDFPKRKGRQIQFAAFAGVEALDNDKRTVLYRVAQEALTNVAKHAQASVVKVVILKAPGGVCLEIADNGKAFDVGRLSAGQWGQRLGLIGMRERVEMVGGRFSVESAPGTGTTIRAMVPFGKNLQR